MADVGTLEPDFQPRPMKRKKSRTALQERIGYRFKDETWLEQALTHVSASPGNPKLTYQRLEFLGDHVLGLVVSDMLFREFPKADEGDLSRRLAELVRRETCAEVAAELALGDELKLGASESNSGGRSKPAILSDVCESLIGAIYCDGGYQPAADFVHRLWRERMLKPHRPLRDSKTILQEWAQARGLPPPAYKELERRGPDHKPEFRVAVDLPGMKPTEGLGASKRDAEQAAASAMLAREGVKEHA